MASTKRHTSQSRERYRDREHPCNCLLELPAWCGSSQPRRASSPSREVDGDDPRAAPAPTSVRPQESRHGSLRFCLLLLRFSVQQYSAFPRLPRFLLRPSRNVDGRALATPYAEGAARRHASVPNVWGASPRSPPSISRDAACSSNVSYSYESGEPLLERAVRSPRARAARGDRTTHSK